MSKVVGPGLSSIAAPVPAAAPPTTSLETTLNNLIQKGGGSATVVAGSATEKMHPDGKSKLVEFKVEVKDPSDPNKTRILTVATADPNATDFLTSNASVPNEARAQDWMNNLVPMMNQMAADMDIGNISYNSTYHTMSIEKFDPGQNAFSTSKHMVTKSGIELEKNQITKLNDQKKGLEDARQIEIDKGKNWISKPSKATIKQLSEKIAHLDRELAKLKHIDTAEKIQLQISPRFSSSTISPNQSITDFRNTASVMDNAAKVNLLENSTDLAQLNHEQLKALDLRSLDTLPPNFSLRDYVNALESQNTSPTEIGLRVSILLKKLGAPTAEGKNKLLSDNNQTMITLLEPLKNITLYNKPFDFKSLFFSEMHPETGLAVFKFCKENTHNPLPERSIVINPKFYPDLASDPAEQAKFLIMLSKFSKEGVTPNLAQFKDYPEIWDGLNALKDKGYKDLNPAAQQILNTDKNFKLQQIGFGVLRVAITKNNLQYKAKKQAVIEESNRHATVKISSPVASSAAATPATAATAPATAATAANPAAAAAAPAAAAAAATSPTAATPAAAAAAAAATPAAAAAAPAAVAAATSPTAPTSIAAASAPLTPAPDASAANAPPPLVTPASTPTDAAATPTAAATSTTAPTSTPAADSTDAKAAELQALIDAKRQSTQFQLPNAESQPPPESITPAALNMPVSSPDILQEDTQPPPPPAPSIQQAQEAATRPAQQAPQETTQEPPVSDAQVPEQNQTNVEQTKGTQATDAKANPQPKDEARKAPPAGMKQPAYITDEELAAMGPPPPPPDELQVQDAAPPPVEEPPAQASTKSTFEMNQDKSVKDLADRLADGTNVEEQPSSPRTNLEDILRPRSTSSTKPLTNIDTEGAAKLLKGEIKPMPFGVTINRSNNLDELKILHAFLSDKTNVDTALKLSIVNRILPILNDRIATLEKNPPSLIQ